MRQFDHTRKVVWVRRVHTHGFEGFFWLFVCFPAVLNHFWASSKTFRLCLKAATKSILYPLQVSWYTARLLFLYNMMFFLNFVCEYQYQSINIISIGKLLRLTVCRVLGPGISTAFWVNLQSPHHQVGQVAGQNMLQRMKGLLTAECRSFRM